MPIIKAKNDTFDKKASKNIKNYDVNVVNFILLWLCGTHYAQKMSIVTPDSVLHIICDYWGMKWVYPNIHAANIPEALVFATIGKNDVNDLYAKFRKQLYLPQSVKMM
eukprot:82958_1